MSMESVRFSLNSAKSGIEQALTALDEPGVRAIEAASARERDLRIQVENLKGQNRDLEDKVTELDADLWSKANRETLLDELAAHRDGEVCRIASATAATDACYDLLREINRRRHTQ